MQKKTKNIIALIAIIILAVFLAVAVIELFKVGSPQVETFTNEFSKIEIVQSVNGEYEKATNAEILIENGNVLTVEYDGVNPKETVSWEVFGDTLYITIETDEDFLGGIAFYANDSSQIKITIPETFELEDFSIAGDFADLRIEDATLGNVLVNTVNTKIDIYNSTLGDMQVDTLVGNVTLINVVAGDTSIYSLNANPLIMSSEMGNLDIWLEIGNIFIDQTSILDGDLYTKLGYVDLTYMDIQNLTIVDDYGNASVSVLGDPAEYACYTRITDSGGAAIADGMYVGNDSTLKQISIQTYYGDIFVTMAE